MVTPPTPHPVGTFHWAVLQGLPAESTAVPPSRGQRRGRNRQEETGNDRKRQEGAGRDREGQEETGRGKEGREGERGERKITQSYSKR